METKTSDSLDDIRKKYTKKKCHNLKNDPNGKWEVVDPNGKVLETFRQKNSAKEFISKHSYFGLKLEVRLKE